MNPSAIVLVGTMGYIDGSCFERSQFIYLCCVHCAEMTMCRREPLCLF